MSKQTPRKDKTCLNCQHVVEKKYCGNCGQENTESRKTFHHLFTHFIEDLVHYDSGFWKTIRILLTKPGFLSTEYLAGKRKSYVPPVKMYIFINFLTFFLMSILVATNQPFEEKPANVNQAVKLNLPPEKDNIFGYESIEALDAAQVSKPEKEKLNKVEYWMMKRFIVLDQTYTKKQFVAKLAEGFIANIPKVLFLYMPFFAFCLWIFHNKKRWYYFEHGIFTLHYFSFMLLTLSFYFIISYLFGFFTVLSNNVGIIFFGLTLWWFFYFFRSHRKFYGESKLVSRLKGLVLFVINMVFIVFFLGLATIYAVMAMH